MRPCGFLSTVGLHEHSRLQSPFHSFVHLLPSHAPWLAWTLPAISTALFGLLPSLGMMEHNHLLHVKTQLRCSANKNYEWRVNASKVETKLTMHCLVLFSYDLHCCPLLPCLGPSFFAFSLSCLMFLCSAAHIALPVILTLTYILHLPLNQPHQPAVKFLSLRPVTLCQYLIVHS